MNKLTSFIIFLLRVALGWLLLYAGITKLLDADWSAAGYLANAHTFPELYAFFARPEILPYVDFLNQWGLTIIGVSLILGLFVRWSALFGALVMLLYYFPVLQFPRVGEHSFVVDEHIIYALVLLFFAVIGAGRTWGLDRRLDQA